MVKTKQWDREAKEVEGAQQLIFGAYLGLISSKKEKFKSSSSFLRHCDESVFP